MWSEDAEEVAEEVRRRAVVREVATLGDVRGIVEGARDVLVSRVAGKPGKIAVVVWFEVGKGVVEKIGFEVGGVWARALERFARGEAE